jgi:hypothetical protein
MSALRSRHGNDKAHGVVVCLCSTGLVAGVAMDRWLCQGTGKGCHHGRLVESIVSWPPKETQATVVITHDLHGLEHLE